MTTWVCILKITWKASLNSVFWASFPESNSVGWVGLMNVHRRRRWHPTPVLLPGKSHGWRSLVGCSPWGHWESDTTERLHFHFSLLRIGEGNGNLLQCSCLENPRDREPGGLPSMGSHRVGHDWSDAAAVAAAAAAAWMYISDKITDQLSWKLLYSDWEIIIITHNFFSKWQYWACHLTFQKYIYVCIH